MKLLIKQRVFSWTDTYDVYDEAGETKYYIKGEALSLGHRLHVYDAGRRELGLVKEKLLTLLPCFEIFVNGVQVGEIQKKFSFMLPKYELKYQDWHVEGDFLGWNYAVYRECCPVVHIKKELWHWGDTYVIEIDDARDELAALLLVLAIDAANCQVNS